MSYRRKRRKNKKSRDHKKRFSDDTGRVSTSRHHRKCKSHGGTWASSNIKVLPVKQHQAWHTIFTNCDAYGICKIINKYFIDPAYRLVVVPVYKDDDFDGVGCA